MKILKYLESAVKWSSSIVEHPMTSSIIGKTSGRNFFPGPTPIKLPGNFSHLQILFPILLEKDRILQSTQLISRILFPSITFPRSARALILYQTVNLVWGAPEQMSSLPVYKRGLYDKGLAVNRARR